MEKKKKKILISPFFYIFGEQRFVRGKGFVTNNNNHWFLRKIVYKLHIPLLLLNMSNFYGSNSISIYPSNSTKIPLFFLIIIPFLLFSQFFLFKSFIKFPPLDLSLHFRLWIRFRFFFFWEDGMALDALGFLRWIRMCWSLCFHG